jgi:hypothetical protein
MVAAVAPAALASDLDGHWSRTAMEEFIENGWLLGYGGDQYGPDDTMTYRQFATVLERVSGYAADVNASDADQGITRETAMALTAQALALTDGDGTVLARFSDGNQVRADVRSLVAAMVEAGYIHGTAAGTLLPSKTLTRAEGVTILHNALDALTTSALPESGLVFGTATLTYAQFYAGNVTTTDGYGIDGVSSATVSKHSIMSNMSTDFTEDKTEGYHILGVQNVNVAVDVADYEAYVALNPTFKVSRTTPEQYKLVTVVNGEATYSATQFSTKATITDASVTLKTGSNWGDYEIDITENSTKYLRNDRTDDWAINSAIQGVILETSDGLKVGLEYLQSIWVQPYEVSFNVSADSTQNAHIAGWDNLTELSKLEGKTITSVTYIMQNDAYVYEFADGIYVKPTYTGDATIKAQFTDGSNVVTLTGIPDVLENVTVTITCGSGRQSVTVADKVAVENGAVTMTENYDSAQTYTVKVSSSNFADITAGY